MNKDGTEEPLRIVGPDDPMECGPQEVARSTPRELVRWGQRMEIIRAYYCEENITFSEQILLVCHITKEMRIKKPGCNIRLYEASRRHFRDLLSPKAPRPSRPQHFKFPERKKPDDVGFSKASLQAINHGRYS